MPQMEACYISRAEFRAYSDEAPPVIPFMKKQDSISNLHGQRTGNESPARSEQGIVDMMNYIRKNWEMIVDDIEHGTLNKDVCEERSRDAILPYIKANPKRAAVLRKIFEEGFDTPIMPRLWPKISCVINKETVLSGKALLYSRN